MMLDAKFICRQHLRLLMPLQDVPDCRWILCDRTLCNRCVHQILQLLCFLGFADMICVPVGLALWTVCAYQYQCGHAQLWH